MSLKKQVRTSALGRKADDVHSIKKKKELKTVGLGRRYVRSTSMFIITLKQKRFVESLNPAKWV